MKVGDKVKILGGHYSNGGSWDTKKGQYGVIVGECKGVESFDWYVETQSYTTLPFTFSEDELVVVEGAKEGENSDMRRFGHPKFYELTEQENELHSKKNHDYAGGGRPLGNFERVSTICSLYPGLDTGDQEVVTLIYMLKQLDAVLWNLSNKHELKMEGRPQRYIDISIYAKLANIMCQEQGEKDV